MINFMEDIRDVMDRWAKIFEKNFSNQEEGQKYVPPSKRSLLPTSAIDQIMTPFPEPSPSVQTAPPEAPHQPQFNKEQQTGEQRQSRRWNSHKLSFPEYNRNEEPSQWLYKCNKFFLAQNTREDERMQLAAFHCTETLLPGSSDGTRNRIPNLAPIFSGD